MPLGSPVIHHYFSAGFLVTVAVEVRKDVNKNITRSEKVNEWKGICV